MVEPLVPEANVAEMGKRRVRANLPGDGLVLDPGIGERTEGKEHGRVVRKTRIVETLRVVNDGDVGRGETESP